MVCLKEILEQRNTLKAIQNVWILVYVQMSLMTVVWLKTVQTDVYYLQTRNLSLLYSLAVTTAQIQPTRNAGFGSHVVLDKF